MQCLEMTRPLLVNANNIATSSQVVSVQRSAPETGHLRKRYATSFDKVCTAGSITWRLPLFSSACTVTGKCRHVPCPTDLAHLILAMGVHLEVAEDQHKDEQVVN